MGVTATGARAGVWTPDAGSAYQRLAFNFFRNDASFSAGRDRREGFKEFTNTNLTYGGRHPGPSRLLRLAPCRAPDAPDQGPE